MGTCTTEQLKEDTHLTRRQVVFWTQRGYLHPIPGSYSNAPLAWPEQEQVVARRMGRLVRAGLLPASAAEAARHGDEYVFDGGVRVTLV